MARTSLDFPKAICRCCVVAYPYLEVGWLPRTWAPLCQENTKSLLHRFLGKLCFINTKSSVSLHILHGVLDIDPSVMEDIDLINQSVRHGGGKLIRFTVSLSSPEKHMIAIPTDHLSFQDIIMGNLLRDRDVLLLFVHLPELFSVHKGGMLIGNLEPFAFIPLRQLFPSISLTVFLHMMYMPV